MEKCCIAPRARVDCLIVAVVHSLRRPKHVKNWVSMAKESKYGDRLVNWRSGQLVTASDFGSNGHFTSLSRIYLSRIVEKVPKNLSSYAPDQDEGNKQQCN